MADIRSTRPQLRVRRNSTGPDIVRPRLNFIEANDITITLTDDPVNNEIDLTIESTATDIPINQSSHGFTVGQPLFHNGTIFVIAKADAASTLGLFFVSQVTDSNNFTVTTSGRVTGLPAIGLVAGEYSFVSESTAGTLTTTQPTAGGSFTNPIIFADTTASGWVIPFRPHETVTVPTEFGITTITSATFTASVARTILADTTSNAITITLPPAANVPNRTYRIKLLSAANAVTIDGDGSETIDKATTQVINISLDSIDLQSDGTEWWLL